MSKLKNILPLFNLLLIVALILFFVVSSKQVENPQRKIAYIDNIDLFEGFDYQKELIKQFESELGAKQKKIDSLNKVFDQLNNDLKQSRTNTEQELKDYNILRKRIVENNKEIEAWKYNKSNQYTALVWERLNKFINNYGKLNDYDIILGAQANGNLMYGDSLADITKNVLEYCNSSYQGE